MRKINAPGIEFNEIDLSQYDDTYNLNGTAVVINGFSDKGTNYRTQYINSLTDFTNKLGKPTNEAERYFYNAVKEVLDYGGNPVVTKLPYKNKALSSYTYCDYVISSNNAINISTFENVFTNLSSAFILSTDTNIENIEKVLKTSNKYCDFITKILNPEKIDTLLAVGKLFSDNECFNNTIKLFETEPTFDGITSAIIAELKSALESLSLSSSNDCFNLYLSSLTKSDIDEIYSELSELSVTLELSSSFKLPEEDNFKYYDLTRVTDNIKSYINIKFLNSGYITDEDYDKLVIGESGVLNNNNSIRFIDITRAKYEKDTLNVNTKGNSFLGIVPVLVTPAIALFYQNIISGNETTFNDFKTVNAVNTIGTNGNSSNSLSTNVAFNITIDPTNPKDSSLEKLAVNYFPKINYITEKQLDPTYLKQLGVVVFKMVIDNSNFNKINFIPVESYVGSLDKNAKDLLTNRSTFLGNLINENSSYINFFSNCDFSSDESPLASASTFIINKQPAISLGFYESDYEKNIDVNVSIINALDLIFEKLKNHNLLNVDLVLDAGISNIAQFCSLYGSDYEPKNNTTPIINNASILIWRKIINTYDRFCKNERRDCMFIADSPRNLSLLGNQKIVRPTNPMNTIENSIVPSIKYLTDINTSYGAGYAPWFKIIDDTSRTFMWVPPSVKVIDSYLISDALYNPWAAPAGTRRGRIRDVYDISFNPNNQEAEQFYINRWNYAIAYPTDGIILEGQKTFQANKTAFDRVNVRRLFLTLEKNIKYIAKSYLYEQLTESHLSSFRNSISKYLENIQQAEGIIDFYIIADGRNNTPTTIDNNTLNCTIGIKPTKTLEFIVLNFVCTTQGANVEEVTTQLNI